MMRGLSTLVAIVAVLTASPAFAQDPNATPEEVRGFELMLNDDPEDDSEARGLLEIAAAAGRAEAVNALAAMVGRGIGGPQDDERAFELLGRAADLGSVGANLTLADLYIEGAPSFPRDPARGFRHAVAAAESTDNPRSAAWAQWRLGMRYLNGEGVSADAAQAYRWVARAADNGSVHGMLSRAVMLATGEGVQQNAAAARDWYLRAAETGGLGSAHALRGLGAMLIVGEGGPVDVARGYAFLLLAQEGGDEMAAGLLRRFDSSIDARAREQAPGIMTAWRLSHGDPEPDNGPEGQLN